jgi:hypothetical protein
MIASCVVDTEVSLLYILTVVRNKHVAIQTSSTIIFNKWKDKKTIK